MLGTTLFHRILKKDPQETTVEEAGQPEPVSLNAFGQAGESIRDQIALYRLRMLEIRNLEDEFDTFSGPIEKLVDQHSEVQAEASALRSKLLIAERNVDELRRENRELDATSLEGRKAYDRLSIKSKQQEHGLEKYGAELKDARADALKLRENLAEADAALQQERASSVVLAVKVGKFVADLTARDARILNLETQNSELDDRLAIQAGENMRLRGIIEDGNNAMNASKRTIADFTAELSHLRAAHQDLNSQLASERHSRNREQLEHDRVRNLMEGDIAKIDAELNLITGNNASLSALLDQSRAANAKKTEEVIAGERAIQDLTDQLNQAENQKRKFSSELTVLRDSAHGEALRVENLRSAGEDLQNKLKLRELEVLELTRSYEKLFSEMQFTLAKHTREIDDRDAALLKLQDEFEKEQAERTLAQGALMIARVSREKLSEHLDALREHRNSGRLVPMKDDEVGAEPSNVLALRGANETNK